MSTPQICIAVTGSTMAELRRNRDAADGADLIELRLDTVDRPDPAGALEGRRGPVIATCRAAWEGGHFRGSEEERRRILEAAIAGGAEFVDVEAKAEFARDLIDLRNGRGIVLSSHYFDGMPDDLPGRWRALKSAGAEVPKLAVSVRSLAETLEVASLADPGYDAGGEPGGHVLIAMGDAGFPTRVLASRLRNRWTYAGRSVAPGQVPASRLLGEFHYRRLQPSTALYGVVGNPVMHSRSPAMHNAGFRHFGLDAVYLPLQAADAADFVRFARAVDLAGASITAPFKLALMSEVEEVDAVARRVGAINTLVVRDGRWVGANTDVHGFAAPLLARMPVKGLRAVILGAGGAARAVAVALADSGAAVSASARRPEAAREIADLAGGSVAAFPPRPGTWDVLVNAIPAGDRAAVQSPIEGAVLDGRLVYELVYAPAETKLLADARAAGCTTIGGLEMLVAQAERQFELWTGLTPPSGLFQHAAGQAQS